jgi:iron complex outermembrane receptor protein
MMIETVLSRSLRLAFVGGLAGVVAMPAMAQTAGSENQVVQRVEITGSSIKRLASETVLPVTVMRQEDIARTGATTAQDLVNLIPGNFGGNVAANNVGATGVASTANLRALGAKYTLVLLNGRRVANFATGNSPVDLNSIPLSAIERIEVLRDGASAVYGADAVAGVINFILKKDYQGMEVSAYKTHVDQGGGNSKSLNLTGGFGNLAEDRFNVMFSANYEKQDPLHAKDRSFANTADRPDLGINKASPRNGVPNLNFTDTNGNKYTGVNPYRYVNCKNDEFALVVNGPTSCGTDYVKFIDLIPQAEHKNFVTRGVFNLTENHQLYAEAALTKDESLSAYSPAPYTRSMSYPASGRFYPKSITLPKGMTLPAGYRMPDGTVLAAPTVLAADMAVTPTGNITGTWRTVAGGPRTDFTEAKNQRFVIGSKGSVAGWDYDTALTYGKNEVNIFFGPGKFSYAKLTPLVNAGEINVFGSQDATSLGKLLGAQITGFENGGTSTSTEFDFKVSKEIFQLPAGNVGLALGTSIRKEKLAQVSSDTLASGDEVGGSGEVLGVTGDRKVYGLFGELVVPVVEGLEANLAARYDKYKNGFGTTFDNVSPKVGLTYRPDSQTMIRASAARGFRAPTLYDNLIPNSLNNTSSNFSDPIRCPGGVPITSTNPVGELQDECNVQLDVRNGGNRNLEPEKSKQFTLGIVFQPTTNLSGSVDYWNVKIDKAINPMSENTPFGNPTAYVNQFWRYDPVNDPDKKNPIQGSTNPDFPLAFVDLPRVNTGKFYAAGWDFNLNYRKKTEFGTFGANLDGTLYARHGYQYQGEQEVSDLGAYEDFGPVPRYRQMLTLTWNLAAWNASLTHNYTDGYLDFTNDGAIGANYPAQRKVAAYKTIDATIGWKAPKMSYVKNLTATFGIKNILDTDPPSSRTEANFQTGYDATFTNPLGRTYYFRINYKFL